MADVDTDPVAALATLRAHQASHPLSILSLAEPILSSTRPKDESTRSEDSSNPPSNTNITAPSRASVSNSDLDSDPFLTPASLQADLTHYKDLFSKLRFSYLEQVTKEKYLRSIVGDPPLVVTHDENLALETRLAAMKTQVKAHKDQVDALVQEMETTARDLATKYQKVTNGMTVLERLPNEIAHLQRDVDALVAEVSEKQRLAGRNASADPRMNMSLEATETALEEQTRRNKEIDDEIEALQRQLPAQVRQVDKMDRELADLEKRRNEATRIARDLQRRRIEGGRDDLEDMGRWYKSSETVLRGLLGVN
ncbi:hypothetical protein PV10_08793 [Exophiala mesophila]|uniref:Kinetochore protein Sos7 coiled-coil domain-containing protein n=1 Tax=Exophiala mesophila TaxID=212818 RepID=A0A0D1WJX7_EXOME|nr:uncharacterized protein PV10_08793 [Exophiala mesophila]KIV89205.1 hypothetical protein PV10_08793 [Exophiala mesophila]